MTTVVSLLAACLALYLPWLIVPAPERRPLDWLWAFGVGASLGLTLLISGIVFWLWNRSRLGPRRLNAEDIIWAVGGTALLVLVALTGFGLLGGDALSLLIVIAGLLLIGMLAALCFGYRNSFWFLTFVGLHTCVVIVTFLGIDRWLAGYQ